MSEQVRRARLQDLDQITELVHRVSGPKVLVGGAEVTEWLYSKGVWIAIHNNLLVGVAAWQAENLLAVTDVLYVAPDEHWLEAGSQLLDVIEREAHTLMCEANVVLLPSPAPEAAQALLREQGYAREPRGDLHRIWQEVLSDLVGEEPEVMVKRLRDRMVMAPL